MCLRLRNDISTSRPIDYYWLYIEATPLKGGKKAGESNYKSFYTFETEPQLFEKILSLEYTVMIFCVNKNKDNLDLVEQKRLKSNVK